MEPAAVEMEDVVEAGILRIGVGVRRASARCEVQGFWGVALTPKCWSDLMCCGGVRRRTMFVVQHRRRKLTL